MIFGFKILKKERYHKLTGIEREWIERKYIIKNNDIDKEKRKLEKKYQKYIGRWFEHPHGFIFQIRGICYDHSYSYSDWHHFKFMVYVPNWEEGYTDVRFEEVIKDEDSNEENMCGELTKQQVKNALM
jgi:hypothetical protein